MFGYRIAFAKPTPSYHLAISFITVLMSALKLEVAIFSRLVTALYRLFFNIEMIVGSQPASLPRSQHAGRRFVADLYRPLNQGHSGS